MTDTSQGVTSEPQKRNIAKHELIDAQGNVVDKEELAYGIRYTQLATGEAINYIPANEAAYRMHAVFGMKTLATNEASQVRNNPKGAGTDEEQTDAIKERFALVDGGTWIDRTRDGVGAAVDKDKMAEAVVEVLVADGKVQDNDAARATAKAEKLAKLESDKGYAATARKVPGVAEVYSRLMGRPTKTLDDL